MTSAVNRLPLSSGNRWLLFFGIALLTAACSPKLQPVAEQPRQLAVVKPPSPKVIKPVIATAPITSTIALLLPFGLDHLAPGTGYSPASLHEADIATAYYHGFEMALDSLTAQGYNYKLLVFDTRSDKAQSHSLAFNPAIRTSNLIVGPVFPDDMKSFTGVYSHSSQPVVSPLSPASPASFKNPELITMMPPLEYHAWAAAKYLEDKIDPEKVFILRSGFSEENEYLIPFKKAIDSLGKKKVKIITLTVMHGQLNTIIPQLSANAKNVFIIPATDQHFLTITLRTLDSLHNIYPVAVFGHPAWINFSFLKAEMLQRLNTYVTSSDHINYKLPAVMAFMRKYHEVYHIEATTYAIKGFDEGFYLGQQLATGNFKNLTQTAYTGLHNNFEFDKKPGLGWINTHVDVYKYVNFDLVKVE